MGTNINRKLGGQLVFNFVASSVLARQIEEGGARRHFQTIRSSINCLIAACALRNGLTILHKDPDYDSISTICPLIVKSI